MAGLVSSKLSGGSVQGGSQKITPQMLEKQMHVNPDQKQQIQRIVVAGMKVMFSPQTHGLMQQVLQSQQPLPQKIGQGVAGLIGLLMKESPGSIPPNLVIPVGVILCAHVADFLRQAGQACPDSVLAQGISIFKNTILQAAGVDPGKVNAMAQQGKSALTPKAPAAPDSPMQPMLNTASTNQPPASGGSMQGQ